MLTTEEKREVNEQLAELQEKARREERDRLVRKRALLLRLLSDYGPRVRRNDPSLTKDARYQKISRAVVKTEKKLDRLGLPWS